MLSCTGKRSHRHTILHVSFSNSFGLASARPTPQGLSGAPVESKMQKFDKQVFYAGKGYIDFINWIGDKADAVAKCYSEIENMDEAKSTVCKKLIVAIFDSTIDNWAKCCPEIATYCNIDFDGNTKISPIGCIHYTLASTLQKFEYPQIDSSSSESSFVSEIKALGYFIIGYILNAAILACVFGIIITILK